MKLDTATLGRPMIDVCAIVAGQHTGVELGLIVLKYNAVCSMGTDEWLKFIAAQKAMPELTLDAMMNTEVLLREKEIAGKWLGDYGVDEDAGAAKN